MASFSSGAFDTGAFDAGAYDFGGAPPPVIVVIDTHDGERKRRRDEEFKQARERLREQIRIAIDGPDAPELSPQLEAIAVESKAPLELRVDLDELVNQIALLNAVRQAAQVQHEQEQKERELRMRWDEEDNADLEALML